MRQTVRRIGMALAVLSVIFLLQSGCVSRFAAGAANVAEIKYYDLDGSLFAHEINNYRAPNFLMESHFTTTLHDGSAKTVVCQYDEQGIVRQETITINDQIFSETVFNTSEQIVRCVLKETDGDTQTVYTYDAEGRRTKCVTIQQDVETSVEYQYDRDGNLSAEQKCIKWPSGAQNSSVQYTYEFDDSERMTRKTAVSSYESEPGLLTAVSSTQYTYQYDEAGNCILQRMENRVASLPDNAEPNAWKEESFSYDENGRLLTQTIVNSDGDTSTLKYRYEELRKSSTLVRIEYIDCQEELKGLAASYHYGYLTILNLVGEELLTIRFSGEPQFFFDRDGYLIQLVDDSGTVEIVWENAGR